MLLDSLKLLFVSCLILGGSISLSAMPTPAALEKARPLIQELMADDFAALKAGKKTHEAVGDAAMKLLSNAETEAAKFLLCKAAFGLYIRGKAYDKAADVLETFRESIADLPTSDLVDLVQKNAKGVRGKDAPKLFAAYRALQTKATAEKERDKARAALADNPTDATLRRAYAEWCVHAGDWKSALASFAKLEGDFAKAVQNENADRAAAADFWWSYEPTVKSTALKEPDVAFKRHAVALYKRSQADGSLSGLRKNLAEKRIVQLDESLVPANVESTPNKTSSGKYDSRSYIQKGLIAQWDGIDNVGFGRHDPSTKIWKDLKGNVDFQLKASAKIEPDCIYCDGTSLAGVAKKKIEASKIACAEVVFEFISAKSNTCFFVTGTNHRDLLHPQLANYYDRCFGVALTEQGYVFNTGIMLEKFKGKRHAYLDFVDVKYLIDGTVKKVVKREVLRKNPVRGTDFYIGGFLNSAMNCRIYSIRFYDRILTETEVKTNFAVDKARFGL